MTADLAPQVLAPQVLAIVLHGPRDADQVLARVRHWQPVLPAVRFVPLECRAAELIAATIQERIDAVGRHADLVPAKTILVAAGIRGRVALDLLLSGAIAGAGFVGLDLPLELGPGSIVVPQVKVRLVQHGESAEQIRRFQALREALQSAGVDFDGMLLPESTRTDARVATRAGAAYLGLLAAQISTLPRSLQAGAAPDTSGRKGR